MSKLRELQLGPGQTKPFQFEHSKRSGEKVTVDVLLCALTQWELDRCRANAPRTIKDLSAELKEGKSYNELLETATTVEILACGLRDADPEKPNEPWALPLELAQALHPGAIVLLSRAWEEHQEACSPLKHELTPEAYNAIVELVAKEGTADPLFHFASPLRSAFITTMASELLSLRMDRSSRSSESSTSSMSTESPPSRSDDAARDQREMLVEALAELGVMRDSVASLSVRMSNVEADQSRARAPSPT